MKQVNLILVHLKFKAEAGSLNYSLLRVHFEFKGGKKGSIIWTFNLFCLQRTFRVEVSLNNCLVINNYITYLLKAAIKVWKKAEPRLKGIVHYFYRSLIIIGRLHTILSFDSSVGSKNLKQKSNNHKTQMVRWEIQTKPENTYLWINGFDKYVVFFVLTLSTHDQTPCCKLI